MSENEKKITTGCKEMEEKAKRFTLLVSFFYPVLFVSCLPFMYWREGFLLPSKYFTGGMAMGTQVSIGLAFAMAVVWISVLSRRLFDQVRRGEYDIKEVVGNLSFFQILVIASLSGITEELLFRGVLQPAIGIWGASALFGIVHPPPTRNLFFYPIVAAVIGLGLWGIFLLTGESIVAPMIAHVSTHLCNI